MKLLKPRITLLPDYPNWAFDYIARSISKRLKHRFDFKIKYTSFHPNLNASETDLLYIFFWEYKCPPSGNFKRHQIIREIPAWPWKINEDVCEKIKIDFVNQYLQDCICATTPAAGIHSAFKKVYEPIVYCPNGVEYKYFASGGFRCNSKKELRIGWVGNPHHPRKGFNDIIKPAAKGFKLFFTDGNMSRRDIKKLYQSVDVLAIASVAESQPLPLLESMASGCFAVTTNVGIVPEIIKDFKNGLVVNRTVEDFRAAFEWCNENLELIRSRRTEQKAFASSEDWDVWANRFGDLFDHILSKRHEGIFLPGLLQEPIHRGKYNDTIKTNLEIIKPCFKNFCKNLVMDFSCFLRSTFLGGRFQQSKIRNSCLFFISKYQYWMAVTNRFFEIVNSAGILAGIRKCFDNFIKK